MSVLKVFVNSDPFVWWSLNEDKLMKMNSDYQLKCYIFIDQSIDIFTLIFNLIVKRLKQRFQTLKFQTLLWITNDDLLIQTLTNKTNLNSINIGQFISIDAPPPPPPPPPGDIQYTILQNVLTELYNYLLYQIHFIRQTNRQIETLV